MSFGRQTSGAVVCASCGQLVGVKDESCYHCGRRNPALWGFSPALRRLGADLGFVKVLIGGCAALYLAALLMSQGHIGMRGFLGMLSPSPNALLQLGASGAIPVFGLHQWWTLLSAGWLHGSALHILFNMMWVRDLAPPVAEMFGVGRTVVIYTVSSVIGFAASSAAGLASFYVPGFPRHGALSVGASAAIFGLLGALICYGRRTGQTAMKRQVWTWAAVMFVFGLIFPGVDNWAHAGGFAGGYVTARILDPLKPERANHLLAALVCFAATFAAIAASFLAGLARG